MKQTTRLVSKEEAAAIRARAVEHAKNATGTTVRIRGLGDVIAAATAAVGIKPCGGCKKRQELLNDLVPFNTPPEG
jgi:hypothetical protein